MSVHRPVDPALLFMIVECSIGKDRQPLPAKQRCGDSLVVATFDRPAQQTEDFVTAERDFAGGEVIQTAELDTGQQDFIVFECAQAVAV